MNPPGVGRTNADRSPLETPDPQGDARALMSGGGLVMGGATAILIAVAVTGALDEPLTNCAPTPRRATHASSDPARKALRRRFLRLAAARRSRKRSFGSMGGNSIDTGAGPYRSRTPRPVAVRTGVMTRARLESPRGPLRSHDPTAAGRRPEAWRSRFTGSGQRCLQAAHVLEMPGHGRIAPPPRRRFRG